MTDDPAPEEPLNAVADALIDAHGRAVEDGDELLIELIEGALLHVGRRLALEVGPHRPPLRN